MLLISSIYHLVQWKLPVIQKSSIKWTILAAGLDNTYITVLYTRYIKCVPTGVIGSLYTGTNIVLTALCTVVCLRRTPSWITGIGALVAVIGIVLTLYSALYPVFNPPKQRHLNPEHFNGSFSLNTREESVYSLQCLIGMNETHSNPSQNFADNVTESYNSTLMAETSYYDMVRSVFKSNTVKGVLTIMAASIPCTLLLLTLSGPLKEENAFSVNFWLGALSTPFALVLCLSLETLVFPMSAKDIVLCFLYGITVAGVNFSEAAAMKFISPLLYDIMFALNIPIMLIIGHHVLAVKSHGGVLEILGGTMVFVVGVSLPLVEYIWGGKDATSTPKM